jgi:nucleoside-diphosphate-sugar epimerase
LAGKTYVPESWQNPGEFYRVNINSTINALNWAVQNKVHFIMISAYIYGIPQYLPIDEKHPVSPSNPYAQSKYLAEETCRYISEFANLPVTIFRLFNVIGPGQNYRFLIPYIFKQIKDGKKKIELMDLSPRRDFVDVRDVARVIVLSLHTQFDFEIFNIGSGKSYSINEILNKIEKITNKKIQITEKSVKRKNEISETVADIKKAKQMLNWSPRFSIDNSLQYIWENMSSHD